MPLKSLLTTKPFFHRLSTILLSTILIVPLFLSLPTPSHAATPDVFAITKAVNEMVGEDTPNLFGVAEEFCQKRNGELMNLETWFSGKCGEDVKSSIQGEGVGFVDIIALQGIESLTSLVKPPHINFAEYMAKYIIWLSENGAKLISSSQEPITEPPYSNSTLGSLSKTLSYMMTTKPASTASYVSYIASNLKKNHIVPETFAAGPGYGFQALSPILPLWRAFRNIAYLLFALAFVLYGIMIMFRIRIDSKTAATIQLAIPKLIATLLMITFSYAIVGLLIDIMTVFMALSIDILRVGGLITGYQNVFIKMVGGVSNLGLFASLVWNGIVAFVVAPQAILNVVLGGYVGVTVGLVAMGLGVSTGLVWLVLIVFVLALLFSYGKIFFAVLKSYISVVMYLIFSPIILLGNIFPGSNAMSTWIMGIIANLAVFPVISFFLVLSYVLMMQPWANFADSFGLNFGFFGVINMTAGDSSLSGFWTPPMTSFTGTLVGTKNVNSGAYILALLGLMILFMASQYAQMVMDALRIPPFKYGSAIGESLKWGWTKTGLVANNPGYNPTLTSLSNVYTTASNVMGVSPGPGALPKKP